MRGNEDVVHHMELFHCPAPASAPAPPEDAPPLWAGSCDDPAAPPQLARCKKVRLWLFSNIYIEYLQYLHRLSTISTLKVLAAWAIGAGPFSYPAEAGLAIGGPGFSEFVMLEVHYNNPGLRHGVVDSSGTWHVARDTCPAGDSPRCRDQVPRELSAAAPRRGNHGAGAHLQQPHGGQNCSVNQC